MGDLRREQAVAQEHGPWGSCHRAIARPARPAPTATPTRETSAPTATSGRNVAPKEVGRVTQDLRRGQAEDKRPRAGGLPFPETIQWRQSVAGHSTPSWLLHPSRAADAADRRDDRRIIPSGTPCGSGRHPKAGRPSGPSARPGSSRKSCPGASVRHSRTRCSPRSWRKPS